MKKMKKMKKKKRRRRKKKRRRRRKKRAIIITIILKFPYIYICIACYLFLSHFCDDAELFERNANFPFLPARFVEKVTQDSEMA